MAAGVQTHRAGRYAFDPHEHREALTGLLPELVSLVQAQIEHGQRPPLAAQELQRLLRRYPRAGRGFFSRSELIAGFRELRVALQLGLSETSFVEWLRRRPVRTQSGVAPITVFTEPFPCPGQCIFCPSDVRMPKSYLSAEPGCQRAEQNGFDPYLQTFNRLSAFRAIGHAVAKAEIIVLGGTWSFYPEPYQRWFVKRCFDAMNDFDGGRPALAQAPWGGAVQADAPPRKREAVGAYNRIVKRALATSPHAVERAQAQRAGWDELEAAQRENERRACRNVGFVVETRPDRVDEAEVMRLRRLGCTKIQIGIQSLSDRVLALNKRGHDVAATRRALRLLREAGFKIHAHFMANLHGSTPAADVGGFRRLFDDRDLRPDELKVYPCSLIETAELMEHFEAGRYRPYTHDELCFVLEGMLEATPRYCRLSRVIRDISSGDIVAGNRTSNFRELAERRLVERGVRIVDIRSREIRGGDFDPEQVRLRTTEYPSAVGQERFIELCTGDDRLLGFVRLSLPQRESFVAELGRSAVIRELHVYGAALALGTRHAELAQHRGFGRRLLGQAIATACEAGYATLSVISAVGTRPYYRALGFRDGELYQHLDLAEVAEAARDA